MNALSPFESAAKVPQRGASQATRVEQSRAVAEVQAAVVVARSNPRSHEKALAEMREVCNIPQLAERAFFRFSRGETVSGETVHLARELARVWGNVTYGLVELSRDDDRAQSEMMAFAWDLETNARSQTTFIVPHVRDTKKGPKALTDVRDVYENNANMGARRLREMIFAVLPVWFREEATELCRKTLEEGGGKPLAMRIAACVKVFGEIGVSRQQLARKVGRANVDALTAQDVATLGVIYKSIRRGEVSRDEEFPREELAAPPQADGFEAASAGQQQPAQQPEQETAPPPAPTAEEKPAEQPQQQTAPAADDESDLPEPLRTRRRGS